MLSRIFFIILYATLLCLFYRLFIIVFYSENALCLYLQVYVSRIGLSIIRHIMFHYMSPVIVPSDFFSFSGVLLHFSGYLPSLVVGKVGEV